MLSRISAAFNPTQWPHFAARLGAEATLFERLAAVVSGDGLVLIGMAVPLWWTALDRHEDSAWRRAEVVLPLALLAMLGLEGGLEHVASSPSSPTVAATWWDGFLCLFVLALGAAWMEWRPAVSMSLCGHPGHPSGVLTNGEASLTAAAWTPGCWPPPQPSRWPLAGSSSSWPHRKLAVVGLSMVLVAS